MESKVMAAIQAPLLEALKKLLEERFIVHLPPLLGNATPEKRKEKQVARALSAFTIQSLFGVDAKFAANLVVDDIEDHGVDAFYYNEDDKTLYFIQSKLKVSEQFKENEAQS